MNFLIFKQIKFLFLFLITALLGCEEKKEEKMWFRHYTVSTALPPESHHRFGTPAMADFDNDGDMDFALSKTKGTIYLFEYLGDNDWKKHAIGTIPTAQLGGEGHDVDGDGWVDLVAGGHWFRNSQNIAEKNFTAYQYDTAIDSEIHDLVLVDMNGDTKKDLVVLGDKEGCFWYDIPVDPLDAQLWEKHVITMEVLDSRADIHGGFFPGGIGDLDSDGDNDVVLVGRWYRNDGSGLTWSRQFLPFGSSGYWGLSGRSWILDMDLDGDKDIVMVGGDQIDSRGAWLENNGKATPGFQVHLLPLSAAGRRGSFHSLWVADFDLDGDQDIFTMDQEDPSILPKDAGSRAFIWENLDGRGGAFKEHVLLDKNFGGHDVKFGDADGDGDLDAYFKIWSAYSENSYGGKPHVDYLENLAQ